MHVYNSDLYLRFTGKFRQPKPWEQYCDEKMTDSYRFGVAMNNFPRQQDPATTTLYDSCAQVHHTCVANNVYAYHVEKMRSKIMWP